MNRFAILILAAMPLMAEIKLFVEGNNEAADIVRKDLAKGEVNCITPVNRESLADPTLQVDTQYVSGFRGVRTWNVSVLMISKDGEQWFSDGHTYPKKIIRKVSALACGKH
jgi:hypothetical protein